MGEEGRLRTYFFENPPDFFFFFFTLPLEIPNKTKLQPWKFPQNYVRSFGKSKAKPPRPLEITRYFFLVTLGNFLCYFSDAPGNSISSPPPSRCLVSSPIAHLKPPSWLPTQLPACQRHNLRCAQFGMVANSVYIRENLS